MEIYNPNDDPQSDFDMGSVLLMILPLYFYGSYIVNLIQFFSCDFEAPYRDEIIHGIGLFGFSIITVWL